MQTNLNLIRIKVETIGAAKGSERRAALPNANDRHRGASVSNDMQLWETRRMIRNQNRRRYA